MSPRSPSTNTLWPESSMKPPISPLCTWQGKVIRCKCIDPRGLIQLDEDPGRVITFHRQRSRCSNTGLSGRLGADSQRWQEKQQIMVWLSRTSSGNWREIQWALKEMLPYSKPTVSLGDDYRLGCIVKCIKRHKMKISASPDVSPAHIEEHHAKFKGYKSVRLKMVRIPSEGVWRQAPNKSGRCLPFIKVDFLLMPQGGGHIKMPLFLGEMCTELVWHLTIGRYAAIWGSRIYIVLSKTHGKEDVNSQADIVAVTLPLDEEYLSGRQWPLGEPGIWCNLSGPRAEYTIKVASFLVSAPSECQIFILSVCVGFLWKALYLRTEGFHLASQDEKESQVQQCNDSQTLSVTPPFRRR